MDDAVIERKSPTPIPVLSPTLHCIAMTAFVFLRTSFGYTFLRPKSVLLAFAWAFTLAFIVAWNEPLVWREYRAACIYTIAAVSLYLIHFSIAFYREWRKRAKEDHYPGTPHAERISRFFRVPAVFGEIFRFWVEPGFVALLSLILRFAFGEPHLSDWLLFVAFCMVGREAINHWTGVRRDKAFGEGIVKAKRQGETLSADDQKPAPAPKAVRTEPVEIKRKVSVSAATDPEARFGKILRLRPPYSLAKAEENFRKLIVIEQSDAEEHSPESNDGAGDLNEAIEFFREKLGG
jgi:hypothetical protein